MPIYDYECEYCGHQVKDVYQSFKSDPLTLCEQCGRNTLSRIPYAPHVFVKGEPTTLGQLAEKNSSRMGKAMVEDSNAKDKESKKSALAEAKKEMRSKINKMNPIEKQRYIRDGKT